MYYVERSSSSSSGDGISGRVNVPSRDKIPSFENKCDDTSLERRAVLILGKRYALTAMEFKFLEIGINISLPSYVEFAIGDHQRKELILSLETWKGALRATSQYSKFPSERL
ncbi:hypothetical protein EAG_02997 [Camponotus floridanus]|uniref:Uncharacterized protein n=1 Tax=Camponotus floridanus TaxID=104421 RepID=E2AP64_CAMFO|nr:hypothetical protein EAG_02997 [Camponotus floridanus]